MATRLDNAGLSASQIADHLGHHSRPSLTQHIDLGHGTATLSGLRGRRKAL